MDVEGKYYVLNGGKKPSGHTNSWNVEKNTITISEGGNSCGYVSYNIENFYCGGHCYYLTLEKESIDSYFLFQYLKFKEREIMNLRVGSGLPNIQKRDMENINIPNEVYEKQKKIGKGLLNFYNKIEYLQTELNSMKKFKIGLLSKLFI